MELNEFDVRGPEDCRNDRLRLWRNGVEKTKLPQAFFARRKAGEAGRLLDVQKREDRPVFISRLAGIRA